MDSNLLQLESNQKESVFKASTRPWFQEAINSNDIIKTQPYSAATPLSAVSSMFSNAIPFSDAEP